MPLLGRRSLLRSTAATTLGFSSAGSVGGRADASPLPPSSLADDVNNQVQREKAWAWGRGWFGAQDDCDANGYLSYFLKSSQTVLQDATVNHNIPYPTIAATFPAFLNLASTTLGPGRVSKLFHITGDVRYGLVAEHVYPKDVFTSTNGYTTQTILDLDSELIVRNTDYWDSRELGQADLTGPTNTAGVVEPFGTIHSGGMPLQAFSLLPPPPGNVALATGDTGRASVSAEMLGFIQDFQGALQSGSLREILSFFAEGATYVNPLIHQGPVLYGNFDQTVQIRGRNLIANFFAAALEVLPDCRNSTLIHAVGGSGGGGFEWKAGGLNGNTGIDRTGLNGCTALDLFNGKIQRMSVKFDTYQMDVRVYDAIRASLSAAGVVDQ